MMKVIPSLNRKEQAVCCFALQQYSPEYSGMHCGLLFFVNIRTTLAALDHINKDDNSHILKQVAAKINAGSDQLFAHNEMSSSVLMLNDAKVGKRFGLHPERGVPLPWTSKKKVTVGMRWSLPKRDWVPDDNVLVQQHVKLKMLRKGSWMVTCPRRHAAAFELWLTDNCC